MDFSVYKNNRIKLGLGQILGVIELQGQLNHRDLAYGLRTHKTKVDFGMVAAVSASGFLFSFGS